MSKDQLTVKHASGRAVEDRPVREILAKVVEMMLRSGSDEEQIISFE